MRRHRIGRIFLFSVAAVAFGALFGFVVMHLWNWLLPALFGWHAIGFWQAVGILILGRIIFGRMPGFRGPGMYWRGRMMERWEQMSPEEREKFRQGMRGRCGPFSGAGVETPTTEQKA